MKGERDGYPTNPNGGAIRERLGRNVRHVERSEGSQEKKPDRGKTEGALNWEEARERKEFESLEEILGEVEKRTLDRRKKRKRRRGIPLEDSTYCRGRERRR